MKLRIPLSEKCAAVRGKEPDWGRGAVAIRRIIHGLTFSQCCKNREIGEELCGQMHFAVW